MKKYFLGFLLLLSFIQPLAVNMLVSNAKGHSLHTFALKSPTKKLPATKTLGIDSVLLDIDDDENTDSEVQKQDAYFYSLQSSFGRNLSFSVIKNSVKAHLAFTEIPSKPIYILWNVFRI